MNQRFQIKTNERIKDGTEREEKVTVLARQILEYSRDRLVAAMPLLSHALLRLPLKVQKTDIPDGHAMRCGTDGSAVWWEPEDILSVFQEEPEEIGHRYLHMVLHCIYTHMYSYDTLDALKWDVACDIAVEHVIKKMRFSGRKEQENLREHVYERLLPYAPDLTAEQIYRFLNQGMQISNGSKPKKADPEEELIRNEILNSAEAFCFDDHTLWHTRTYESPEGDLTIYTKAASFFDEERQWQQIYQTISLLKEERSLYEGSMAGVQQIAIGSLSPAMRDYADLLKRFSVLEEETELDPDAFDMIFYTYGLSLYGNLPLIEPLEYKESCKIRSLVIAIDTSGSCQGEKVRAFLKNTCAILTGQNIFFDRFQVAILQCDSKIQKEDLINSKEEFERYMCDMEIYGAGGTDFRPVFSHVKEQLQEGRYPSVQGLVYFTDGLGQYPDEKPPFPVLFIYPDDKARRYPTPLWADSCILRREDY